MADATTKHLVKTYTTTSREDNLTLYNFVMAVLTNKEHLNSTKNEELNILYQIWCTSYKYQLHHSFYPMESYALQLNRPMNR